MAAVPPPDPASMADTTKELVELSGFRNNGTPLAIVEVLAHRPELLAPFLQWSAVLSAAGALGERRHEIAALRVAWHHQSAYEWGQHARYGLAAGLTEMELAWLGSRAGVARFARHDDAAIVALVDAMCDGQPTTDARDAVTREIGEPALVDLLWAIGQYAGLSMVADTLELPLDADVRPVPPYQPAALES